MSKTKGIIIACWSIVAIVLIGLAAWFVSRSMNGDFSVGVGFETLTGPYSEVGAYAEPADGINGISVNWIAGEINITPYDGDTIRMSESARRELKEGEKLRYEVKGGVLKINYTAETVLGKLPTKKLELLVPAPLAEKLGSLDVVSTSASLKVSGFRADSFTVQETSGATEISGMRADKADVGSISGAIRVSDLGATALNLHTVSGEIVLSGGEAGLLTTSSTSGAQDLIGTFDNICAGSVSGTVNMIGKAVPDTLTCSTTSGEIRVTLPGSDALDVNYTTTSGNFSSEIPVRTGSSGAPYQLHSVSGSIHIYELKASQRKKGQ